MALSWQTQSRLARNDRGLKTLSGIEAAETAESLAQERSRERKGRDSQRYPNVREEEP
jgi:hypothetical protein